LADLNDADENLTGWTVFPIHLPEVPDQALLVSDTSGRLHRRSQVDGVIGEHYGIQILARSAQDPATPYKKIKAIMECFDSVVYRDVVTLDNKSYRINAITRTGSAAPAGNDGRRYFYSGNFIVSIELIEDEETGTGS